MVTLLLTDKPVQLLNGWTTSNLHLVQLNAISFKLFVISRGIVYHIVVVAGLWSPFFGKDNLSKRMSSNMFVVWITEFEKRFHVKVKEKKRKVKDYTGRGVMLAHPSRLKTIWTGYFVLFLMHLNDSYIRFICNIHICVQF